MAKGTILFLFFLTIVATLLIGINIGKKFNNQSLVPSPSPTTPLLQPTTYNLSPSPQVASNSATTLNGITKFTNRSCGYEVSYPENWKRLDYDAKSVALENPATTSGKLAIVCAPEIPRVPLQLDKIEVIKLSTSTATLYHDASPNDGTPIDKIIAKIPGKNMDIFIGGLGSTLKTILNSFKFIP